MELLILGVLVVMGVGIALAGRWCKTVPMQILVGILLGLGGALALGVLLLGVLFAGCVVLASTNSFR